MVNNSVRYKPTNDYIFSRIFGNKKNWELLKDFLEAILPHIKIRKILLVKQFSLVKQTMQNRGGTLDILAVLNDDTKFIIYNFQNLEKNVKEYQASWNNG